MRIAVLVKQVPRQSELQFVDGRLVREGVPVEVNAYCRRANAKATELARSGGARGEVIVFTMGPPQAELALREMLACGADRAVHLCDPAFAGSDTLATARALAAAIRLFGPFDLVLAGLNSIDADTGQVGPQIATFLDLPFATGARTLDIDGDRFRADLETDDGLRHVEGPLPAVISTAERLCDPSKAAPEECEAIDAKRILRIAAKDLGLPTEMLGTSGSPTTVGPPVLHESTRTRRRASTAVEAAELLESLGALTVRDQTTAPEPVPTTGGSGGDVWCLLSDASETALLGEAAALAHALGGSTTAILSGEVPTGLGAAGADHVLVVDGSEPDAIARSLASATAREKPWALLVESSRDGREIASAIAATNGWGLTGDAIELGLSPARRLVSWKPALGGRLVVPIESDSPVQLVTIRPGVLARRSPRPAVDPEPRLLPAPASRIVTTEIVRTDHEVRAMLEARALVGVGLGVRPEDYPLLDPLREVLGGAPLAGTRKVTDVGWLPRSRQIGITGHAVAPDLYVAIGISGRFNHVVGVQNSGTILAINSDPAAAMFDEADVGLVGDWRDVVPTLVSEITRRRAALRTPAAG